MDLDCAICCSIHESIKALGMICQHIDFSCQSKKEKSDFGLDKFYVERQIEALEKMQEWHNYYHATGKSLKGIRPNVNYPQQGQVFRRFRPG